MDLGSPSSYLALKVGTDVYSSDHKRIGSVARVLYDEREDVFDGIILTRSAVTRRQAFADADEVASIHERGVILRLNAAASARLPEPSANPAVIAEKPSDRTAGRLRRTWDRLSGRH